MRGKWLILWFALVLSALIIGGCGSTESTATSSTTGGAGETPAPVQPAQPTEAPVDAPDPVRARDVALAYVSGRYGEQAPALGLTWTDENVTPEGLVGASTFQFAAHAERGDADWAVTVSFPIVAPQATVYQVVVANQVTGFQWEGEVDAAGQVVERGDAETPDAMFEGISFSYDDALAAEVVSEIVPARELTPSDWGVMPEHVGFSFNGYVLPNTFHEPWIHVYPINDLKAGFKQAGTVVAELQQLLAAKPAMPETIPILPSRFALMRTQIAYVDFQNGTGVRFLCQLSGGGLNPINNHELVYTFQGLTDDGNYYVAAILPASHPLLPADGMEAPGGDWGAFAENFETYKGEIEGQLDAQEASSFAPDLSLLDVLIQSLEVAPMPSAGVVEPPTEEAAQPSEIVSLDETWNQYTNHQLGFSIKVPKTMVSFLGSCKWNEDNGDHSYRPESAFVPVKIFEDAGSVHIAAEYYHKLAGETTDDSGGGHFYAECNKVTNSLALLQDPDEFHEMWEFVVRDIQNDEELEAFIKSRYGSSCSLGEKTASAQAGVYDVSILGDGKDLEQTQCPLNYWAILKYDPQIGKVIAWNPGQAYTFAAALDYSVVNDQEMIDSFWFLNGTPAEPSGGETTDLAPGSIQTRPADGMDMVYVPAGEFLMGSDDDDMDKAIELCTLYGSFGGNCTSEHFQLERPAHPVALDGFWMDRTEVTNAQFYKCVEAGVCDELLPPVSRDGQPLDAGPDQAAVYVFMEQARVYCEWAGGRLPTEAEWEYAARGPEGLLFPWGDEFDGSRLNYCDAKCGEVWGDESTYGKSWADASVDDGYAYVAPVGSFPGGASWCGVLDLAGNVSEWVADAPAPYTAERQVNPSVTSGDSEFEIARGGSWYYFPDFVRSANRFRVRAAGAMSDVGFRCVVPGSSQ